jgi:hypothetical protein
MSKARLINLLLVASLFAFVFAITIGTSGMSDGGGFHFL